MWKINGTVFKAPTQKSIALSTQHADLRTIGGGNHRDYIGGEKIIITCTWDYISSTDYAYLKNQYDDQRLNSHNKTLVIDELTINMNVILDLVSYDLPLANHYNYRSLQLNFIQT